MALRDCNIFLENLVAVPGLEEEERQRWLAEVKVLKAFYHFWLLRMYGPIPTIKTNIYVGATAEEAQVPRESVDDVVEYIVQLLDEVIESNRELYDKLNAMPEMEALESISIESTESEVDERKPSALSLLFDKINSIPYPLEKTYQDAFLKKTYILRRLFHLYKIHIVRM